MRLVAELPPSIDIYNSEREYMHDGLDLAYIAATAKEGAKILATDVLEVAYQPGDGTYYGLVIVPLASLVHTQPRVKKGIFWQRHAVHGQMRRGAEDREPGVDFYADNSYLVCWVENTCYPLRLGDHDDLAASYIDEKWKLGPTSAVSVALFLRALSYELSL